MTTLVVLKFYFRRAWRIYPALSLACCAALCFIFFLRPHATGIEFSDWFVNRFAPDKFTGYYIAMSFAGLIPYLVPPAWSIFVELAGSTFLPLIAYASRQKARMIGLFLVFLVLSFTFPTKGYYAGMYLVDFVIGAALIGISPLFAPLLRKWRGLTVIVLALSYTLFVRTEQPLTQITLALAAAAIICSILSNPDWRFLDGRLLARLGDISYSIYILHFPIMCTAATFMSLTFKTNTNYMALLLIAGTVFATLGAAELSYRFVELSGIRAGKVLSNFIFSR